MSPVSSDIRKFFNEHWHKNNVSSAIKVERSVLLWTKVLQRAQIQENSSANTDPRKLPAIKVMFKDQWDKQSFSLYGIRSESSWANTKFCGLDSTSKMKVESFVAWNQRPKEEFFWWKHFSPTNDTRRNLTTTQLIQKIKLVGSKHIQDENSLHQQHLQQEILLAFCQEFWQGQQMLSINLRYKYMKLTTFYVMINKYLLSVSTFANMQILVINCPNRKPGLLSHFLSPRRNNPIIRNVVLEK